MNDSVIVEQIRHFLDEDIGSGDLTAAIISDTALARAEVMTREPMVVCGQAWFDAVFKTLDENAMIDWRKREGQRVTAGTTLCSVSGRARALLSGERTALNVLQTLSATATLSRQYADAVAGTGCRVLDTRKTIPGLRLAQKYAVKCGGCENHRMGLYDGVLIKENHIIAAGSIASAVKKARSSAAAMVEVEVENLQELQQAIAAQPDRIMLDNFSLAELASAVELSRGEIALEASGDIGLNNIRQVAETGVDFISIGALTKNVSAINLSMRITLEG